jgi:hypothetical protein
MATAPSAIGPTIRHPERTRAMTDGAIPVDKLKSERSAQYADLEARSRAEMPVVQEGSPRAPVHLIKLTEKREITPYKWMNPGEDR